MDTCIIRFENIVKHFGGVQALNDVSFDIYNGQIQAIVGENGAGKSTLMKILTGIVQQDSGTVKLEGKECEINDPLQARKHGISIVYQELNLFPDLTISANMFVAKEKRSKIGFLDTKKMKRLSEQMLEKIGADISPDVKVADLTIGQQQLVEISRALLEEAKILILDEPNSALTEDETQVLFDILRTLTSQGVTIILVSHRLQELFEIADWVTILRDGRHISTVKIEDVTTSDVVNMMVGTSIDETFPERKKQTSKEILLEVKGIIKKGKLDNINLSLKKGEILGLAGLEGCGIEDVFLFLFGLSQSDKGEIYIKGIPTRINSPEDAINNGIAFIPADRRREGLMLDMTIKENITISILSQAARIGFLREMQLNKVANEYVSKLNIATDSIYKKVTNLSGGNQQKVVLAKWLATEPQILILNDPTRGIDVLTKAEVYRYINELAKSGLGIIFTSSELDEIIGICDRILVLYNGKIIGEFQHGVSKEEVAHCRSGYTQQ